MTTLTTEQLAELHKQGDRPLQVVDPTTNKVYFVIAGDLFDQLRAVFDDSGFDLAETYAAQSQVAGEAGWDDPEMGAYDDDSQHPAS